MSGTQQELTTEEYLAKFKSMAATGVWTLLGSLVVTAALVGFGFGWRWLIAGGLVATAGICLIVFGFLGLVMTIGAKDRMEDQ